MPDPSQSLRGIVTGMMQRASSARSSGVVGEVLEGITGEIEAYNKELDKSLKLKIKLQDIAKKQKKLEDAEVKVRKLREKGVLTEKQFNLALKAQLDAMQKLNAEWNENNKELDEANGNLEKMGKKRSIMDSLGTSAKFLAVKIAGAATAYFSFSKALESVETRASLSATQVANLGDATNNYWDTMKRIKDGAFAWNDAINRATKANASFGISVDDTNGMIKNLSKDLKLTTDDYKNMAQIVGQTAEDIGFLSRTLQVDTDTLVTATTEASRKFNKSTTDMTNDLAGVYDAIDNLRQGNKNLRMNMGDMTRMVLEAQGSFQGYNLNLRQTAQLMGKVAAEAQKQGATYEMSMKAAQGLVDIISGGKAPDWAKYLAGDKLLDEVKRTTRGIKDDEGIQKALAEAFSIDPKSEAGKSQLTGLANIAKNYKEYGAYSAANMTDELLRGTEAGNKAMFALLKKYGTGQEGRELLKRVWGLDDAAATAATFALQGQKNWQDFSAKANEIKAEGEAKKPPTVRDLRDQTEEYVAAIGAAQTGIVDTIKAKFESLAQNPAISMIVGGLGTATTGIMQLVQTGMMAKMMGLGGGGGAAGGAGALGGAAGVLGKAGAVAAAGLIGVAIGTWLRETFPIIDTAVQKYNDGLAWMLNKATFGFVDLRATISDTEQTMRALSNTSKGVTDALDQTTQGLLKIDDQNSYEYQRTAKFIQSYRASEADLEAFAEKAAESGKITKEEALTRLKAMQTAKLSEEKFQEVRLKRLKEMSPEQLKTEADRLAGMGGPKTPEQVLKGLQDEIAGVAPVPVAEGVGNKAGAKAGGPPPVVTVTRLTAEQKKAVSVQVATSLAPEIKETAASMFEGMAKQSSEYFESMTSVATAFWQDLMPKAAQESWAKITEAFKASFGTPLAMTPLAAEAGGEGGAPGVGAATSVGPDGSIRIMLMIPRNALDKSNRQSAGYVE